MRYCEKCGYVIDEFAFERDNQNCPVCNGVWSEDNMTALSYAKLSEAEKDAYDEQLLNRIKSSPCFEESIHQYVSIENGVWWCGFRVDKYAKFEPKEDILKCLLEERKANEPFKPFPEIDIKKAKRKSREVALYQEIEHERIKNGYYVKSYEQTVNVPRCPICQSTRLAKITTGRKILESGFGGIWGMDVMGKTYECRNCGSKF